MKRDVTPVRETERTPTACYPDQCIRARRKRGESPLHDLMILCGGCATSYATRASRWKARVTLFSFCSCAQVAGLLTPAFAGRLRAEGNCWGLRGGVWNRREQKQKRWLTESLTRMNWSTSMTGGALKLSAAGATAGGMLGAATTGTTVSAMGLFFGGRGMVDAAGGGGGVGGFR